MPMTAHSIAAWLAAASAAAWCATAAVAEDPAPPAAHQHTEAANTQPQTLSPASKEFEDASRKMHMNMSKGYTNDVDVDFVRGMIPHHQGAIEQAQILLKYSKNPRLRRLAGGIIAAQRREIRFMETWLKEHDQGIKSEDMPDWLKANPDTEPGDAK